jgi:hypothetical protein
MNDHTLPEPPTLASMSREDLAKKLQECGEGGVAAVVAKGAAGPKDMYFLSSLLGGKTPAYLHPSHAFGFIGRDKGGGPVEVRAVTDISPEPALKNTPIDITLDAVRIAQYPGKGQRRVLVGLSVENYTTAGVESAYFNATFHATEGQLATPGYRVFRGVNVGADGLTLRCKTVNVWNEVDDNLFRALDSDTFRAGLRLASTLQPALGPLAELGRALLRSVATRTKNVPVQEFLLGLNFSKNAFQPRLAAGQYIAVQVPEAAEFPWDAFEYRPSSGMVVRKDDHTKPIEFNFIVFGVHRHEG